MAERLLDKFGGSGTITTTTYSVPDATKPWIRTPTTSTASVKMVVLPWGIEDSKRYFSEDIIISTQKGIILYDASSPIEIDKTVLYQGKTYTISAYKLIKPVSTGIIYMAALSGGEI